MKTLFSIICFALSLASTLAGTNGVTVTLSEDGRIMVPLDKSNWWYTLQIPTQLVTGITPAWPLQRGSNPTNVTLSIADATATNSGAFPTNLYDLLTTRIGTNDADLRYIQSEIDPLFLNSPAYDLTDLDLTNLHTMYQVWGDHRAAGYLTNEPDFSASVASTLTVTDLVNLATATMHSLVTNGNPHGTTIPDIPGLQAVINGKMMDVSGSPGQVLICISNNVWAAGTIGTNNGTMALITSAPLASSVDTNGNILLSITNVWTNLFSLYAAVSHGHAWDAITGKPSTYPPSAHSQDISTINGLQTALDGKAAASHTQPISTVTGLQSALDAKADISHNQAISTVTGLQSSLDALVAMDATKLATNATASNSVTVQGFWPSTNVQPLSLVVRGTNGIIHGLAFDSQYDMSFASGTIAKIIVKLAGSGIYQDALPSQILSAIGAAAASHFHDWTTIINKPATYPPNEHTQSWASITNPPSTYAPSAHTQAISTVTGLQASLDALAAVDATKLATNATASNSVALQSMWPTVAANASSILARDSNGSGYLAGLFVSGDNSFSSGVGTIGKILVKLATGPSTTFIYEATPAQILAVIGAAAASHTHAWDAITGKPTTFPPSAHTQDIATINGLQTALDGKAAASHTQAISTVTGLQAALDGKADIGHSQSWASITNPPSTFPPAAHEHVTSDIEGFQTALDAKANTSHTQAISTVTGLQNVLDGIGTSLNGKLPLTATAANSSALGGYGYSEEPTANTIVKRDASGHIKANHIWLNNSAGTQTRPILDIMARFQASPQSGDYWVYSATAAQVKTYLGLTTNDIPGLTAWMTGEDAKIAAREPALGNPSTSGLFLTSTTGGSRSFASVTTNDVPGLNSRLNGKIGGSGTANKLAKFTAAGETGDSSITDNGSVVTIAATLLANGAVNAQAVPSTSWFYGHHGTTTGTPGADKRVFIIVPGGATNTMVFKDGLLVSYADNYLPN